MLVRELLAELHAAGFVRVRQRGSHVKFARGAQRFTAVIHSSGGEQVSPNVLAAWRRAQRAAVQQP